jgi:tetratricopeptide (TPR) repeat protein
MINSKEAAEIMKIFKNVTDYEAKGKFKEAIQEIQKAIKINPRDGNIFNRLGDLHVKNSRQLEAIEAYKKGIEAYRGDNFYRNALALCKKVLKYDPGNTDIYPIIAKLLVDLDEKSDALIYLFEYIERQKKNQNEKEVLKTIDYIKTLNLKDQKLVERLNDIYKDIGRGEMVTKTVETATREPASAGVSEVDLSAVKVSATIPESSPSRREPVTIKEELVILDREESKLKEDLTILDESVQTIQLAVTELRKAIRIDEVVIALDKSLLTLSEQQKKSILNLQQSLSLNLDTLQKSVREMSQGVDKSGKNIDHVFNNLSAALSSLSKNQAFLSQEITGSLSKLGENFQTATEQGLLEIKDLLSGYRDSTRNMCDKLDESKDCNLSLLNSFNEMRTTIQIINDSLTKFAITQESGIRKERKFYTIIIVLLGIVCGLFVVSLFIK